MRRRKRAFAFSAAQKQTLISVLDEIIPLSEDGRLTNVDERGLANAIDDLSVEEPALRSLIAQGLARLDELARAQQAPAFCTLPHDAKVAALDELAKTTPRFLVEVARHLYRARFQKV